MLTFQLKCRRCGGFLYEEEVFYDQNDVRTMQIGCYICSHKGYMKEKGWNEFKLKLAKALKVRV